MHSNLLSCIECAMPWHQVDLKKKKKSCSTNKSIMNLLSGDFRCFQDLLQMQNAELSQALSKRGACRADLDLLDQSYEI